MLARVEMGDGVYVSASLDEGPGITQRWQLAKNGEVDGQLGDMRLSRS